MTYAALLADTCRIVRRVEGAFDPNTGQHAAPAETELFEGPCAIQPLSGIASTVRIGEEAVVDRSWFVFVPVDQTGIRPEDVVIVTASEDAAIVGREMAVRDTAAHFSPLTDLAVRWLVCQDVMEGT